MCKKLSNLTANERLVVDKCIRLAFRFGTFNISSLNEYEINLLNTAWEKIKVYEDGDSSGQEGRCRSPVVDIRSKKPHY
jgi:hypothetical protein